MPLQGARELRARFRAIRTVFKPAGRAWAQDVVILARTRIPARTGKTRASVKIKNASLRKASVVANYPVNFIDHGTKAHTIVPRRAKALRFTVNGKPMFAKKVRIPAKAARPFKKQVAQQALDRVDVLGQVVKLWNAAGGSVRAGTTVR